jgi:hypothetical protein
VVTLIHSSVPQSDIGDYSPNPIVYVDSADQDKEDPIEHDDTMNEGYNQDPLFCTQELGIYMECEFHGYFSDEQGESQFVASGRGPSYFENPDLGLLEAWKNSNVLSSIKRSCMNRPETNGVVIYSCSTYFKNGGCSPWIKGKTILSKSENVSCVYQQ